MNKIKADYKRYTDKFGLVQQNTKVDTSDNGTLETARYIVALNNHNELVSEIDRLKKVYESCQRKPGLFTRSPGSDRQDSPDNFVGIGVAAHYIDKSIARRVLNYGARTMPPYLYNNVHPGTFTFSAWIGRQRQVIAHMKWAAGLRPWFWERLWWCVAIFIAAHGAKVDQDNWTLSWGLVKVAGNKGWIERIAAKYWRTKFQAAWPHGVGQVLESYYHQRELQVRDAAMHPNAFYLWDEFGF